MEDPQKRKRIDDSYYRQIFYMETQEDQQDPKVFEFFLKHLFETKKMVLKEKQKVLAYRFAYRIVGPNLKNNLKFWLSSTQFVQWEEDVIPEKTHKISFSWDAKKQELVMDNMEPLVPQMELHSFVISMGMWIGCRPQTNGWDEQHQMIVWSKKHDRQFRDDMAREVLFYLHCFVSLYHEDLVFFNSESGTFPNTEKYFINACMTCGSTNRPKHETDNRARVFCGKACQILYYK